MKNGIYKEVDGDLIKLALEGCFDVIGHGVNCFCNMGAGIAPQMAKAFCCNIGAPEWYPLENKDKAGDINKLGQIEYRRFFVFKNTHGISIPYNHNVNVFENYTNPKVFGVKGTSIIKNNLVVVNAYTQYDTGGKLPLSYPALTLCLQKINHEFKGKHIGLPRIGCGLAGGNWELVKKIIQEIIVDCDVTIVNYKP